MSNQDNLWQKLMKQSSGKKTSNLLNAQAQTQAIKSTMPQLQVAQATQTPQVRQSAQAQNVPQTNQQSAQTTAQSVAQANQEAYNELLRQSQTAPQSQNDRFIQWWNENAGVGDFDKDKGYYRTDAMDDTTYRIGQNIYDGYLQKQDLLTEYQTQQERLNREKYQQEANANYQKWLMQKYLPDMMNKNGYSGNLGLVRDANLGIDNDYSKSLSNINTSYNDTMNDLTSDYNSNLRTINGNVSNKNDVLYDKQDEKKEQSQNEWYENLADTISTTMAQENPNYDEIYEYLESNKNRISQDRYEQLLEAVKRGEKESKDPFSGNNLQKATSGEVKITAPNGGNYYVVNETGINGAKLSDLLPSKETKMVSKQSKMSHIKPWGTTGYKTWDEINRETTQQMANLGYSSTIDSNIKNGTTIKISLKSDNSSAYYVTYINGLWYRTEKI